MMENRVAAGSLLLAFLISACGAGTGGNQLNGTQQPSACSGQCTPSEPEGAPPTTDVVPWAEIVLPGEQELAGSFYLAEERPYSNETHAAWEKSVDWRQSLELLERGKVTRKAEDDRMLLFESKAELTDDDLATLGALQFVESIELENCEKVTDGGLQICSR